MKRNWPVAPVLRMGVVIFGGREGPKLIRVDAAVVLLVINRATGGCTGSGEGVPLAQLGLLFITEAGLDHVAAPHTVAEGGVLAVAGEATLAVFEVWEWRWRLRKWLQQKVWL
jgi:lipid-binding SYLF domain-containing protein